MCDLKKILILFKDLQFNTNFFFSQCYNSSMAPPGGWKAENIWSTSKFEMFQHQNSQMLRNAMGYICDSTAFLIKNCFFIKKKYIN